MTETQFPKLVELMARLRGPDGCPWDREQTFDTIKPFLLEETYEVVDAIGRRDWGELAGELGDLLLQVVFFARMAEEEGHFTIEDVIERIHTKMVRRHPHVFGDAKADSSADVLSNWGKLKEEEKKQQRAGRGEAYHPPESVLAGVSSSIPSLMEAYQLTSRASHVGFDWERFEDLMDKLREEMEELEEAAVPANDQNDQLDAASQRTAARREMKLHARIEDEAGDLLFTAVNIARFLDVDPESALRGTNRTFRQRFQWMERELRNQSKTPREATLEEMEALWQKSKTAEGNSVR